ncbi:MAG TPA: hypothetical protein VKR60_10885 [Candidatus Sulfotelmatobacter sp.]|nr:hypothetical protein [Candidatus Sulfotelmatobacter sp.]
MKLHVWKIVRKDDGTFEIFHKGNLLKTSIPEKWLEAGLAEYGFCGQEYHDIRRQLELHGRAERVL